MSETNTVVRAMHDLGLATWFGGSLMGAVGLNGATGQAKDPQERLRLSSLGWARWTPVQIAAVGVHAVGGLGLIAGNKNRVSADPSSKTNTVIKTALTAVAAGVTAFAGMQGAKVAKMVDQGAGAKGATEPSATASTELASAQRQLKWSQWAIPALTGALLVLGAQQGEQQRGLRGLLDV